MLIASLKSVYKIVFFIRFYFLILLYTFNRTRIWPIDVDVFFIEANEWNEWLRSKKSREKEEKLKMFMNIICLKRLKEEPRRIKKNSLQSADRTHIKDINHFVFTNRLMAMRWMMIFDVYLLYSSHSNTFYLLLD